MIDFLIPSVLICLFILLLFKAIFSGRIFGEALVAKKLESFRRKNEEYHPFNNVILKTPDGTTQIVCSLGIGEMQDEYRASG